MDIKYYTHAEDNGGGAQRFEKDFLLPFVNHDIRRREALESLLKGVTVRHRKITTEGRTALFLIASHLY